MKRYQTMTAAALLTGALLLTACSQEDSGRTVEIPSDGRITFTASVGDNLTVTRSAANADMTPIALSGAGGQLWLVPTVEPTAQREQTTRGTQLGSSATLSTFGVSAFRHDADDDNLNDDKPSYFYNLQAAQVGETGVFTVSQPYYWPAAGEALTFNAYYPYGSDNVVLTDLSAETKNSGQQSFSVTVATSANDQVDFMTATAKDETFKQNTSPNVSLTFQHQLTAVRFVLGSQFLAGYIKSIAISGVYGRGIYTIGGSGNGWTVSDDDKTDVSISYVSQDRIDKQVDGTEGDVISADGEAFLLIPQTFEADDAAKITILYNDGYDDYTVEASLAGQQAWTAGTTVTYAISSEYLTTLRISELDYPETVEGAPKTEWAVGDRAGMYVVKPDGTTIEYENVPVTYVGGTGKWKWQITHPDGHTIYKLPGYSYYFYYPYVEGTPTGYALTGHSAGEAATDFFSGVITSRNATATTAYDDQGTEAAFTAADLQVAKAEDDAYASTVKATMERQVTMAVVTLGTTSNVPQVIHRSLDTDATFTWDIANGTTTVTASAPTKLYGYGGKYYYWAKWGVNNVLSADGTDPWSATVNITAKNGVEQVTAQSPRTTVETSETVAAAELQFTVGSVTFKVVAVGGGNYTMSWSRYNEYEVTGINGTLSSYWMGQTEVTNGLWNAVMGSKPSNQTNNGDTYPVACVSHIDIMGSDGAGTASTCFIKKLNDAVATQLAAYGLSGRQFTLPSEAQWQWAAMGGRYTHNYTYAGGNDLNTVAWNSANSNSQTHPVAQKTANELALYDMTGNVWEWCRDWYCSKDEIVVNQGTDYVRTTQASSSGRVYRGGGWDYGPDWCPVSRRGSAAPSSTYYALGLRLLLQ